jgi:hypothetical protein
MRVPKGYVPVRFGYVEVGDFIFVPAIGSYIEIEVGSIYLGSSVDSHNCVQRNGHKVQVRPVFANNSERCDHIREYDFVALIGGMFEEPRVVVYKDPGFVYLRRLQNKEGTCNKVCRKSGRVWEWSTTGWEPIERTMRAEGEEGSPLLQPMKQPAEVMDASFYGD